MPTFDVVSEVDMHEIANAVDQAGKELASRYDFRGVEAGFELNNQAILLTANERHQLGQMFDILISKCSRRGIDVSALDTGKIEGSGRKVRQTVNILQGIDQDTAKSITKLIKAAKTKVQASIQGEKVRVTGKKKDDLQAVMELLKDASLKTPLQFNNFRD